MIMRVRLKTGSAELIAVWGQEPEARSQETEGKFLDS